jgi:hypothetical protein
MNARAEGEAKAQGVTGPRWEWQPTIALLRTVKVLTHFLLLFFYLCNFC